MSKASYLQALTAWALGGSRGLAPSALAHGVTLAELTSEETARAIDQGDPRPPAITSWTWWDGTHRDLYACTRLSRRLHRRFCPSSDNEKMPNVDSRDPAVAWPL